MFWKFYLCVCIVVLRRFLSFGLLKRYTISTQPWGFHLCFFVWFDSDPCNLCDSLKLSRRVLHVIFWENYNLNVCQHFDILLDNLIPRDNRQHYSFANNIMIMQMLKQLTSVHPQNTNSALLAGGPGLGCCTDVPSCDECCPSRRIITAAPVGTRLSRATNFTQWRRDEKAQMSPCGNNEENRNFLWFSEKYSSLFAIWPSDNTSDLCALRHLGPHHPPHLLHRVQWGSVLGGPHRLCPSLDDRQQYRCKCKYFGCLNRIMNQQILHFTCELQLKYTLHFNSNKPQELTVINGQSSQFSKSYNSLKHFPWSQQ